VLFKFWIIVIDTPRHSSGRRIRIGLSLAAASHLNKSLVTPWINAQTPYRKGSFYYDNMGLIAIFSDGPIVSSRDVASIVIYFAKPVPLTHVFDNEQALTMTFLGCI
jgi:hypothetical protein